MAEPKVKEVTVSSSVGGKVQIQKYELSADYHYSITRKYDVPPTWTEDDVRDFEEGKIAQIRTHLEEIAQVEVDELLDQKAKNQ